MTPSRYLLLLGLASLFALIGVAQSTRVIHLEGSVAQLEKQRDKLSDENRVLLCDIYALSYPARIADEVGRRNLGLLEPVELSKSLSAVRESARSTAHDTAHLSGTSASGRASRAPR